MVNMIANVQVLTTIDLYFTKRIINSVNTEFESNLDLSIYAKCCQVQYRIVKNGYSYSTRYSIEPNSFMNPQILDNVAFYCNATKMMMYIFQTQFYAQQCCHLNPKMQFS